MTNPLIAKVEKGKPVYGTLLTSTSPHAPPVIGGLGLDFVFIDTEHIGIDRERVSWMCRTFSAMGIVPIVRIPSPDPAAASMMLDAGAVGILVPYVETVEQVQALRGAVKLKPLKGGRLRSILAGEAVAEGTASYLKAYAQDRLLLINIESRPAVDNLEHLLRVPGLDGVIVGPHDLSVSLDQPEGYRNPDFLRVLGDITKTCREKVPITGVHFMDAGTVEDAGDWMAFGFNLLILHADIVYMRRGLADDLQAIRARLGEQAGPAAGRIHV